MLRSGLRCAVLRVWRQKARRPLVAFSQAFLSVRRAKRGGVILGPTSRGGGRQGCPLRAEFGKAMASATSGTPDPFEVPPTIPPRGGQAVSRRKQEDPQDSFTGGLGARGQRHLAPVYSQDSARQDSARS